MLDQPLDTSVTDFMRSHLRSKFGNEDADCNSSRTPRRTRSWALYAVANSQERASTMSNSGSRLASRVTCRMSLLSVGFDMDFVFSFTLTRLVDLLAPRLMKLSIFFA